MTVVHDHVVCGSVDTFCASVGVASFHMSFISRVPDQNGVSLLYIMLEIHHSGWEPSIWIYVRSCVRPTGHLSWHKL